MAQDAFGNYVAGLTSLNLRTSVGVEVVVHGSTAPVGNPQTWQHEYVNDKTGDIYLNVSNAWVKQ